MSELGFELASELGGDGVSPLRLAASTKTLTGYRVVLYTGTNPDDTHSWVWSREVPAGCSSAVVPIAKAIPGVKSATQAIYWGTTPGPWHSSDGSVTLDPETVPIPSVDTTARDDAASGIELAVSKNTVYYSAGAPSQQTITLPNGTTTPKLKAGDIWFNTDNQTGCADVNCKGHALDANGVPLAGVVAHRGIYWTHRWDGSSWKDAQRTAQLIASEAAIGFLVADHIAANGLQLAGYAEDASGNPTAGAKIYKAASGSPPIKVAPAGIQIGKQTLAESWLGRTVSYHGTISNVWNGSTNSTFVDADGLGFASIMNSPLNSGQVRLSMSSPLANATGASAAYPKAFAVQSFIQGQTVGYEARLMQTNADALGGWVDFLFYSPSVATSVWQNTWKFNVEVRFLLA